ncbi:FkbM family methyltransferase [Candidatus Vampirococcus lugosii]|uniref:Precorrin-6B methylase 2 n=1 Tax=Candidatus Vampirococcus lugosii TaxID=2789015 RepID=A0ABS5QJV3_9BACT|nr:FkbM family methyltransferase [Candidatus Vampirococcus lugosii]MBS8121547.1 Precorrin-6B methylase 2 [Candidatus Vampirococcus lugosii]
MNIIKKNFSRLYMAYDTIFNTKVIEGGKFNWIKLKSLSYMPIILPFLKEKINNFLSRKERKNYIIQNKVAKFFLYNNDDTLGKSSQYFEHHLQHFLDDTENKKLFVDIGTNIGFYTLYAINKKGFQKSICFEANPDTFKVLNKNIELNNLDKNVDLKNFGLGDKEDKLTFLQNKTHTGGSKFISSEEKSNYTGENYNIIDVNIKKFDDIISNKNIDINDIGFIKMDVEGFEYNVLIGMKETLTKLNKGTKLFIEIWGKHPKLEETKKFIQDNGFVLKENIGSNYLYIKK